MIRNSISRSVLMLAGLAITAGASWAQTTGAQGGMNGSQGSTNGSQNTTGMQNQGTGMQTKPSASRGMDDTMGQTAGANGMSSGAQQQSDKKFVHDALAGGMAEVELGKLALQKSSNDDVKTFAQRMIDDHTKMGDDMKPVAEQLSVKMPDGLSKKDQALQAKLQAMSGPQFDKAYVHAMVKDHQKDLQEFQREAQSGAIPAVKDAAAKGIPIIQSHLEQVQQLAKANNGSMASMK